MILSSIDFDVDLDVDCFPLEVVPFGLAIRLRWKVKDKREGGDVVSVESFRWEIGFYLGEGGGGVGVGWLDFVFRGNSNRDGGI